MFINLTVCHQNYLKIAIGNYNISKCGRLSQPNWLLDVLFKLIYFLTYLIVSSQNTLKLQLKIGQNMDNAQNKLSHVQGAPKK